MTGYNYESTREIAGATSARVIHFTSAGSAAADLPDLHIMGRGRAPLHYPISVHEDACLVMAMGHSYSDPLDLRMFSNVNLIRTSRLESLAQLPSSAARGITQCLDEDGAYVE
ncbi:hypothetical protein EVAR_79706_1 [Eumeta japonica]|uniref:Uncharacterized protein n=1 Tax=Eumeta variegata TaxID=151549 RepID=A0A4C1T919_EUMVA|nr:hypothetical protein EVAR_79706_1 [Eumeta japonica]